jgi:uncharacterized RDD family membrane protein YckC
MQTPAEAVSGDQRLQDHWISRVVAAIIDAALTWLVALIVCVPLIVFSYLALVGWVSGTVFPLVWGLIYVLYSAMMESSGGATFGKRVMKLHVIAISGQMSMERALKRNISKIYWVALLIDLLIGFLTEGDPRQRYLDRVAGTTVVFANPPPMAPYTPQPPPPPQYAPPQSGAPGAAQPRVQQDCAECGGRLIDSGDGKRQCIRCGKVF